MENTECFGTEPMPYEKAVKSATFGKEAFAVYRGGVPVAFAMAQRRRVFSRKRSPLPGTRAGLLGACRPYKPVDARGKIPLLYTDAANHRLNKAYRNIGLSSGAGEKL